MYYTGIDPMTMKSVYVAKSFREKAMQRALLQWKRPDKRKLVIERSRKPGARILSATGRSALCVPTVLRVPRLPRSPKRPKKQQITKKAGYAKGWAKPKPKKNAKPGSKKKGK